MLPEDSCTASIKKQGNMTRKQFEILRKLAEDKKFGRGPNHANQVKKLSLRIYDGLVIAGMLSGSDGDRMIIEAAALLHDIGLPKEPHNEAAFDLLVRAIPELLIADPLSDDELSTLSYCVLWHRGSSFAKRGAVAIADPDNIRKMAAIIRVADALDRTLSQAVENVDMRLSGTRLTFVLFSKSSVEIEIKKAKEKSDLMKSAYNLTEATFEHTN